MAGGTEAPRRFLTFEFAEQAVAGRADRRGRGTTVELLVHKPTRPAARPTQYTSTAGRFITARGQNRFGLLILKACGGANCIHNASGRSPSGRGFEAENFPWPNEPRIRTSEPGLDRLIAASVNTLHNCAQETLVDGMAQERQQYSGDCGHQTHTIYMAFGGCTAAREISHDVQPGPDRRRLFPGLLARL